MTSDQAQTEYAAALLAYTNAGRALARYAIDLPALPDGGCGCAKPDLRVEEVGYGRWSSINWLGTFWGLLADGMDDFSVDGLGPETVYCLECDTYWRMPENVEWL